jgi:cell division GTPase FtsZ
MKNIDTKDIEEILLKIGQSKGFTQICKSDDVTLNIVQKFRNDFKIAKGILLIFELSEKTSLFKINDIMGNLQENMNECIEVVFFTNINNDLK